MRAFAIASAFAALLLSACTPTATDAPDQWRSVEVTTTPLSIGAETIGVLRFRGGLVLSSEDDVFGGLSGIEVLDDGRLIAISDNGDWFEARIVLDDSGALVGVTGMRTAFIRDEHGQAFPTKAEGDSEDLTQLADGRFAVSFEQTQTIRIYDLNRDGPFGAAAPGPALAGVNRLPGNVGLEAITTTAAGTLLVGAEGGEHPTTPLWLAPLDAHTPVAATLQYPLQPGYSLTALDRLPDGGFIALERFYAPVIGSRARITMFPEASLAASERTVPARELAAFVAPLALDNFEGIATQRMPDGAVRLYIMSDDNFSDRQRTLLYAFDVSPESLR